LGVHLAIATFPAHPQFTNRVASRTRADRAGTW
jgi:hypothetical protein